MDVMLRSVHRTKAILDFPPERTLCDITDSTPENGNAVLAGPHLCTALETELMSSHPSEFSKVQEKQVHRDQALPFSAQLPTD